MVSICIPVYEMRGKGVVMLDELLQSIYMQDYKEYEIIVSDNSSGNEIQDYCAKERVKYFRNDKHDNPASNFNNAINHATGEIIKPMCQDDYFMQADSLTHISRCTGWLVCSSSDHRPYLNKDHKRLIEGENTYGSPSAVSWERNELRFDENLLWLMDCEFYHRLIDLYGQPELLLNIVIGIRKWEGQLTYVEGSGNKRLTDLQYVQKKYRC